VDNGPPVIQTFDQRNLQLYLLLLYQGVGTSPPTGVSVLRAYGRVHLAARLLSPFRPARRRSAFRRETAKGLTRFLLVPYCCCYLLYPHYSCNGEEAVVLSGAAAGSAAQANAELLAAAVQWRGGTRVAFHAALARPLRSIRSSRHVARVVQGRVGDRRQAGGGGRGVRVLRPQGAQREQHWRRLRPGRRAEAAPRGRGGEGRGPAAGGGRARGLGRVGGDALRGARRGGARGRRRRAPRVPAAAGAAGHGPARHRRARGRRRPRQGGGGVPARVRQLRALLLQHHGRRRRLGSGGRRRHKLRPPVHARRQGHLPRRAAAELPGSRAMAQRQGLHLEGQRADQRAGVLVRKPVQEVREQNLLRR
jgi:hypothetical protein